MDAQSRSFDSFDREATEVLADIAMPVLRISLGVVYIWFGALKVAGVSPVAELVTRTVPFLPKRLFLVALGLGEVAIGAALLFRVALRPTLLLFALQLVGTFFTFVVQPERMVQRHNPLLLTADGEFVVKNLVLLSAGMAVGSTVRRRQEELPADDSELRE